MLKTPIGDKYELKKVKKRLRGDGPENFFF